MQFSLLLTIAVAVSAFNPLITALGWVGLHSFLDDTQPAGSRLLEFADGSRQWVTELGVLEAKRNGEKFFDITDHRETPYLIAKKVEFPKKLTHGDSVHELARNLSKANLEDSLTEFSSFHTRYAKSDYGLNSSLWLYQHVSDIAAVRDDITVKLFDHSWKQKSLIAHFEGSKTPEKVVVVGAHQDSINLILPNILPAPGADDDGSGSMTILEVFRVLVESGYVPDNSLEFHWYSNEELGLLGSQDIFSNYSAQHVDVQAMLQQDMTGYSAGSTKDGGEDSLGVIVDYVDEGLTKFIKRVVDEYCTIPYVETTCGYACSDHASASKYGYPSAFVIESAFDVSNKFIHSTRDKVDLLDFDHMLQHAKLTLGYAYELGKTSFK